MHMPFDFVPRCKLKSEMSIMHEDFTPIFLVLYSHHQFLSNVFNWLPTMISATSSSSSHHHCHHHHRRRHRYRHWKVADDESSCSCYYRLLESYCDIYCVGSINSVFAFAIGWLNATNDRTNYNFVAVNVMGDSGYPT